MNCRALRTFSRCARAMLMGWWGGTIWARPLCTQYRLNAKAFLGRPAHDSWLASRAARVHVSQVMHEILPRIFTWGSTYADRPWDLNGYALALDGGSILVDPPAPEEAEWLRFEALKPFSRIILTNRDHVRDAELFRQKFGAQLVAGVEELKQFMPVVIDQPVREGDMIAGLLRVIQLPGKSPGEIALLLDSDSHPASREHGGILFLGDAIIGNPPGALGLIPEQKLDDPALLRRSLQKLLNYQFNVLLFCDGKPVLRHGKDAVEKFVSEINTPR
jgi:glyoxylase-like metal-dependent hydrolase (beta-lactamase superfamily II)